MRPALRASRLGVVVLSSALLTTFALSGCASSSSGPGGGGSTVTGTPATAGSSASAARTPAAQPSAPAGTTTGTPGTGQPTAQPAGGPVPNGFAAASVTFVSTQEAFVLGTAPCSHAPCTSILRTLDRGASWAGLPAPVVPLSDKYSPSGPGVWGIRFADPLHGFVFGNGLWETTDGGEHWAAATSPAGSIQSLEVIDGQVLALTAPCSAQGGCGQTRTLSRRPLSGGSWTPVSQVASPGTIATQGRVAALIDGTDVLVTTNGGLTVSTAPTPCASQGAAIPSSVAVAVTSTDGLALLCAGEAAAGSVQKTVYVSGDLGAHWTKAGLPAMGGDPIGIAAATPEQLVVAAASGASWLYYSGDSAAKWGTAFMAGDGGAGWNDLGFTTTSDGVVVHGPVFSDDNRVGSPGQLMLTSDGGATWQVVRF